MGAREHWTDLEPDEERFLREFGPKLDALRARHAQCPSLESILAAQSAALPEDAAVRLAEHIASCDWCRALGNDVREFEFPGATPETERRIRARVFAGVKPVAPQPWRLPWRWLVPLGAAASLVLTVLLVRDASRLSPPPEATTATRPESGAGPVGQTGALRPTTVFRLEKPPVRLPLAAAMVWRGEGDSDRARFAGEFKAAMTPYRADEYAPAAARLARLSREFPSSPEVLFYLGVCQLFLEREQEAIASLERAHRRTTGDQLREVAWYLALAHQRAGQMDRAEALLSGLCQGANPYSAQACAGIQELKASRAQTDKR